MGLLAGYQTTDPISKKVVVNWSSNLAQLLEALGDLGYACPAALLNPAPRIAANRRRAWLPCVLVGQNAAVRSQMTQSVATLMRQLQDTASETIDLERLLLRPTSDMHEHWNSLASSSQRQPSPARGGAKKKQQQQQPKWVSLHAKVFKKAGFVHPPAVSQALRTHQSKAHLSEREVVLAWRYLGWVLEFRCSHVTMTCLER